MLLNERNEAIKFIVQMLQRLPIALAQVKK